MLWKTRKVDGAEVETTKYEFLVYSDGNAFLASTYDEAQQIHLSSFLIHPMSFRRNGH